MTPDQLAAIRARAEAANPGPWTEVLGSGCVSRVSVPRDGERAPYWIHGGSMMDMAFIAAARQDVPALLADNERLRKLLLDAKKALGPAQGTHGEPCEDPGLCHIQADAIDVMTRITAALEGK